MHARLLLVCTASPPLADALDALGAGHGAAVYALMAVALLLGACGVPVPEEAVLATGGALAAHGEARWELVWLLGWAIVLALDLALHALGARFGPGIVRSRLGRRVGPARWERARQFVARRGAWAVAGARLVMGVRIPTFLLAGAMGMPRRRFLPVVAAVGLVSTALPMALGHVFAEHLPRLLEALGAARWILLAIALLGLLAWWWRARRRP